MTRQQAIIGAGCLAMLAILYEWPVTATILIFLAIAGTGRLPDEESTD
jgi:phosphate/sulfate permease